MALVYHQRLTASAPFAAPDELMWQTAYIYRAQAMADTELFLAGTTPVAAEAAVLGMMYRSQAFALFAGFLQAGMDSGRFQVTPDPVARARALWAAVHGAVVFEICARPQGQPGPDILTETVSILPRGLK